MKNEISQNSSLFYLFFFFYFGLEQFRIFDIEFDQSAPLFHAIIFKVNSDRLLFHQRLFSINRSKPIERRKLLDFDEIFSASFFSLNHLKLLFLDSFLSSLEYFFFQKFEKIKTLQAFEN